MKSGVVKMAVIYDVVEDSDIKISDIAMINLIYVVEKAELEKKLLSV